MNGQLIETNAAYCIYIREETNPQNVHFGRQKVHYPQVLRFEDQEILVDNNAVIQAVSQTLNNYAFIVRAFEYDTETGVLNLDALIVGENGIPYSKVFLIKRGVGEKFSSVFNEYADIYDSEIIAMRNKLGYDKVYPDNFMMVMGENKQLAINTVVEQLKQDGISNINILSDQYPYALFDIEVMLGMKKEYIIVRFTSTKVSYFSLPIANIRFLSSFADQTKLYLVTDVNGDPLVHRFSPTDLEQMKKTISTVTYEYRGVHREGSVHLD